MSTGACRWSVASDQPVSQLQARPWRPAEPPGLSWPGSQGRSISWLDLPAPRATSPALVLTCGDGGSGQGAAASSLAVRPPRACPPLGCPWLLHAGPRPPSLSSWRCVVISATATNDPSRRTSPPVNAALTRGWRSGNWRPRGRGSGRSVSPGALVHRAPGSSSPVPTPSSRLRRLWLVSRLPLPICSPCASPWRWTQQGTRVKGAQGPPLSYSCEGLFPDTHSQLPGLWCRCEFWALPFTSFICSPDRVVQSAGSVSCTAEGRSPRRPDCARPTSALHCSRFLGSPQASPLWDKDPGPQADRSLRSFKCWRWNHVSTPPLTLQAKQSVPSAPKRITTVPGDPGACSWAPL